MTPESIFNEVARGLCHRGYAAYVDHPGYICVEDLYFGTANGVWGCDDGEHTYEMESIPEECTDIDHIVNAICKILEQP